MLFLFGGEKGIRTLDTVPRIHDFQSCAFDQLSHLSTLLHDELYLTLFKKNMQAFRTYFSDSSVPKEPFYSNVIKEPIAHSTIPLIPEL